MAEVAAVAAGCVVAVERITASERIMAPLGADEGPGKGALARMEARAASIPALNESDGSSEIVGRSCDWCETVAWLLGLCVQTRRQIPGFANSYPGDLTWGIGKEGRKKGRWRWRWRWRWRDNGWMEGDWQRGEGERKVKMKMKRE